MGNQYIFFDAQLRDRFMQSVTQHALRCETRPDTMEGFVVELSEEPDDEVLDALETQYETLMDEQIALAESREGWITHQVAGVGITRADGSPCMVRLPADIARLLLANFTAGQVQALVQAVAQSLENPVDGPLCKRA
ncbi:MAG: hypothetical protein KJ852_00825 [Gammaproteobacteria bacterium]|nr:hypothetical protein [Gammaproteobacteria bacterium]MBU0788094.1 hypothetical protein [Gammaproteobacteria bacterium]MBU0815408.1 hypothetical protein [Gammaproteobacteria bacterium]MBU1785484.1 hypothetical protein [Gammaproteobacteria bacterium]